MRSLARASCTLLSGISARAACAGHSGADGVLSYELPSFHCSPKRLSSSSSCFQSSETGSRCFTTTSPPLTTAALGCTDLPGRAAHVAKAQGRRYLHSFRTNLDATSEETPNSVAAALAARPPPPPLPYDSDEDSVSGAGEAPFVPPQIDKLIKMIMRHGKKEQARRIVFDAAHAMHNSARAKNPRPELRQRNKELSN